MMNDDKPLDQAAEDELKGVPEGLREGGDTAEADLMAEALESLRRDLENAKQEVLYAQAETQNMRRRLEREKDEARALREYQQRITLLSDPAYVLKQELLRIPVFGWHARAMGMIPVDRAGGGAALRAMLRHCGAALAEGRQVVIFPEGTRSAPGTRPAYQPGIVAIAGLGTAPLVPVATDSGRIWPRRGFLKHPGIIRISILPPLAAGTGRAALLPALEAAIETESARLLTLDSCG